MRAVLRLDHVYFELEAVEVEHFAWVLENLALGRLGEARVLPDVLVELLRVDRVRVPSKVVECGSGEFAGHLCMVVENLIAHV